MGSVSFNVTPKHFPKFPIFLNIQVRVCTVKGPPHRNMLVILDPCKSTNSLPCVFDYKWYSICYSCRLLHQDFLSLLTPVCIIVVWLNWSEYTCHLFSLPAFCINQIKFWIHWSPKLNQATLEEGINFDTFALLRTCFVFISRKFNQNLIRCWEGSD